MNLRKIFNYPSQEQIRKIDEQYEELKKIAEKRASENNEAERGYENKRNSTCPHCHYNGKEIVNKITRVEGSGSVSGSFFWGTGSVYGSSETDTNEVNHCNKCGNQWKKYNRNWEIDSDYFVKWLNKIYDYIIGKYEYKSWHDENITEFFKDIYAETIFKIFEEEEYSSKLYYDVKENITLSLLREKFKSVYDK
jgi:hypothetical protein